MITKLTVDPFEQGKHIKCDDFQWVDQVEILKKPVEFKPGVNVLFAPNGMGKSTIAGLCAFLLAAKQGGRSVVTKSWVSDLVGRDFKKSLMRFKLRHDGQAVLYVNPRDSVGLYKGQFDDDFIGQALVTMKMEQQSSGEVALSKASKVNRLIANEIAIEKTGQPLVFEDDDPNAHKDARPLSSEIKWKFNREHMNYVWQGYFNVVDEVLTPSIDPGAQTIIMDEPELGFSLLWQHDFWRKTIAEYAALSKQNYQLIIATHSPFALNIEGVNYIEIQKGYIDEVLTCLKTI